MNDLIKGKLSLLPPSPGCYLMKNKEGTVIYVGKAKKLKNRVHSYFVGAHDYKTTKLVSEIVDFEYIVTGSEKEALLLEINLIKDYSPQYNIMFMDNTETYKLLDRLYPLRKCNHIPKKPCLYYSLNQCLAPCVRDVDQEEYVQIKKEIVKLLNGDTKDKIHELTEKMTKASEELNFEQAKEYRDLITYIQHVTAKQHVQFNDNIDRDILGYYVDHGYLSIQLFFMRHGKLLSRDLNLVPIGVNVQEDLQQFIVSFYQNNTLPKEVLLPQDVDDEVLKEILDCKILKPQKGNKYSLVQMAIDNARESLEKKFELIQKNEAATIGAMKQLGELLQIETPHVIELFDNSNIQGAYAVAGMVCFKDGIPSKKDYRKYKIKTVEGPDDYASMREVIYRRYYRVLMEGLTPPDMILVDGGLGQIHVAKEVVDSLNMNIKVCGLAKDDKHSTAMLLDENGTPIPIHPKSELFFLLTRMQDEVHRYAISFHKNVRSKSLFASVLDDIEGIGPKRKKQLLNHFKSVKRMKEASLEELQELLPDKVAEELFQSLQED